MTIKRDFPKVLVLGIDAWRHDATAHTLPELFKCWDPNKVALIYTRTDMPDLFEVCTRYFRIAENDILRNIMKPWKPVGSEVCNTDINIAEEVKTEHERYAKAGKYRSSLMPLAREIVWKLGNWKTEALREFVKDFDPDILFLPLYPTVYMGWIEKYVTRITGKPTVCYLADDNYSYDSCKNFFEYVHRLWLRQQIGPIARKCSQMFVIVDKEKEDTDTRFGTDSVILTKSIDFTGKIYQHRTPNQTLKFVYTGSMVIGRDKTLALLADTINAVNTAEGEVKAELYIYSQTEPNDAVLARINRGAAHFCGRIGRDEVLKEQQEADVVVFAESLEGKEANAAKLSFSTKITDYISNGKCVLAIGKEYIAPIDYFQRNDSALIAHSAEEIKARVEEIVANPMITDEYGEKAFNCAVRNHDKGMMTERFISTMLKAMYK